MPTLAAAESEQVFTDHWADYTACASRDDLQDGCQARLIDAIAGAPIPSTGEVNQTKSPWQICRTEVEE